MNCFRRAIVEGDVSLPATSRWFFHRLLKGVFMQNCNWEHIEFPSFSFICESESCSVVSDSLRLHGLLHGILQARILEWAAFPFYRGSSQPRGRTQVSRIAGWLFTSWATRETQEVSFVGKFYFHDTSLRMFFFFLAAPDLCLSTR